MPRTHVVLAVFRRNFSSYFAGVLGFLFIFVFVTFGARFAFGPKFFANNLANLDQLNAMFPYLLLFLAPAITMGVWSEERKLGTEELLFTMPVSDLEVLIGKYLAVVAVYTVVLAFSLTHVLFLLWIGNPDPGIIAANYLGYWLSGCALLSVGMVASYLTNNSTVAFVLGAALCALPVLVDSIPWPAMLDQVFGTGTRDRILDLSIGRQIEQFGRGQIPAASLFYFASMAVVCLYVNLVLIGRRHWAGGKRASEMSWHFFARTACLVIGFLSLNSALSGRLQRLDLTTDRVFTVSPTTYKILQDLDSKKPVTIQAFVSGNPPRDYVPVKSNLLGLLSQYGQKSGRNITVRVVEVEPYSAEADQARQYGIEARRVQNERDGKIEVNEVFLGAVVSSGPSEVVIPFFDIAIPIEYELTRSIRTVSGDKRLTVGILETDAKVNGGFDPSSMRSNPEWRIITELKKQYIVENVPASAPIDGNKFDVLIAVLPSSLTDRELPNLVEYVRTGKPVLVFDDPIPAFNPSLAPRQPKPRQGGGMFGMGGGGGEQKAEGGRTTSLCNLLQMQWNYDEVVYDETINTLHPEFRDVVRPEMVAISPSSGVKQAFSQKSPVTQGFQELLVFFAGTLQPREKSDLLFEPLLRTGKQSGLVPWKELITSSFFGVEIRENPRRIEVPEAHVIAAHIRSDEKAKDKINVIYVADCDLISDWFFMVRERKMYNLDLDNVSFVLNAVDELAGDRSFIELRKRRAKSRTLARVEESIKAETKESGKASEAAAKEAEQALEDARTKLSEQVKKIDEDTAVDQVTKEQLKSIAEREQQRKLDVLTAKIEQKKDRKIEEIKAGVQRTVRSIEQRFSLWATLLPPIPALVVGMMLWFSQKAREQRDVVPARRR